MTPIQRLEKLEKLSTLYDELETARMQKETERDALILALLSVVRQLAEREGKTVDEFNDHFFAQRDWHRHQLILRAGEEDPSLSERLAPESSDESDSFPDEPPPLFGDNPEQ